MFTGSPMEDSLVTSGALMPKLLCCLVSLNSDTSLVFKSQETLSHADVDMGHHNRLEWFWHLSEWNPRWAYAHFWSLCVHFHYLQDAQDHGMHLSCYESRGMCPCSWPGCDNRNYRRKYGYCMRGISPCIWPLPAHTWHSAIPIVSAVGLHDVYVAEGNKWRKVWQGCTGLTPPNSYAI